MLRGVDVSSFQGPPGAWKAEAGRIDFAAVKFTELSASGRYVNPDADTDWAYLKSAGLGRVAYLFGHPGVSSAASAAFFAGAVEAAGLEDGDGVALDLEADDGHRPPAVAAWGLEVLTGLHSRLHRTPLLYTFLSFAWAGCCQGMGRYPLWIADPSSPAGHPRVPAPWKTWTVHQYQISGGIDRDVAAYPDLAAMRAALGATGHAAPRPPEQPRRGEDDMADLYIPLTAAAGRAVFCPWPHAGQVKAKPPYTHVTMVLAGDGGAQVTVTFSRGGATGHEVRTVMLASGTAVPVNPASGWAGVETVTLARTDAAASGAVASAVVTRW